MVFQGEILSLHHPNGCPNLRLLKTKEIFNRLKIRALGDLGTPPLSPLDEKSSQLKA